MALLRAEPQCGRLAGSGGDVDCGRPPQPNMVSVAQATAKCGQWLVAQATICKPQSNMLCGSISHSKIQHVIAYTIVKCSRNKSIIAGQALTLVGCWTVHEVVDLPVRTPGKVLTNNDEQWASTSAILQILSWNKSTLCGGLTANRQGDNILSTKIKSEFLMIWHKMVTYGDIIVYMYVFNLY